LGNLEEWENENKQKIDLKKILGIHSSHKTSVNFFFVKFYLQSNLCSHKREAENVAA